MLRCRGAGNKRGPTKAWIIPPVWFLLEAVSKHRKPQRGCPAQPWAAPRGPGPINDAPSS